MKMIIKLKPFQKALEKAYKIYSESKDCKTTKNIRLTILPDSSDMIISVTDQRVLSYLHPFSVFINIGYVENAEPMNIELNAKLLYLSIAKFHGHIVYIEKKTDRISILHITSENEDTSLKLPFANMGLIKTIDDKSNQKFIGEIHPEMLSHYLKETKHALETRYNDIKKFSF